MRSSIIGLVALAGAALGATAPAVQADDKISNPIAVFSGLDKITGRIISFDVYIDETVQFGALRITPKACYTRPSTEAPQTDSFVEVDEITLDNKIQRIFTGWMFAASPGLNAVDHPIYDVWLTDCKVASDVPPPQGFDAKRFASEIIDVIKRPPDWYPMPEPRPEPPSATATPDQNATEPPED